MRQLQVPQRRIDGGERDRGDRADRRGVGQEQEVAPDALDLERLPSDKCGAERALKQSHHRRAAGADRVAVAGADGAVGVGDPNEWRFLADEGLDGVDPLHLGLEVDHEQLDASDLGHVSPLCQRG